MDNSTNRVKDRLAELNQQHAELWRQISMSPEWHKLQAAEGAIAELSALLKSLEPATEGDQQLNVLEPSTDSGPLQAA